ncbi:hypothetical protein ACFIJ5_05635 [Haloimpatiens sp. FM7330]|uniref:hypothetical protein n=1 Tax=Haloimpatiens sp. FM7330 TaxID=3298610 RepID=UPI0036379239
MRKIFNNINEECIIIGIETREYKGVIAEGSTVHEYSQKQIEAIKCKKRKNQAIRDNISRMGEYTVHYCDGYKLLEHVSFNTVGALLILSQYIIQNTNEEGFMLIGTQGGGHVKPFKFKKDILNILQLKNKDTINKIIDEAKEANLIQHTAIGYRLNAQLFFKGSGSKNLFTVSFKRSILELQDKLPLKSIGYLFKISEYLPRTKIIADFTLVENPEETITSNIRFLTVEELAQRLNVSVKTILRLLNVKIGFRGFEKYDELPLIIKVGRLGSTINPQGLMLNPLIFTHKLNEAIENGLFKFIQECK